MKFLTTIILFLAAISVSSANAGEWKGKWKGFHWDLSKSDQRCIVVENSLYCPMDAKKIFVTPKNVTDKKILDILEARSKTVSLAPARRPE